MDFDMIAVVLRTVYTHSINLNGAKVPDKGFGGPAF